MARAALLPLLPALAASFRLITFDLDDTLWPTGPVVKAANAALADAVGAPAEDLQRRLQEARSGATPPPSYSEARIRAVESWLRERDGESHGAVHRAEAENMFELWLTERHAAASRLLFDGAAEAIAEVRRLHPDAVVGAITNGRGDPLAMPELAPLFDWTVSAEHQDIYPKRKPAKEPFLAALRLADCEARPTDWAHVGDDLINDVQASKDLGAWSIWLAPAVEKAGRAATVGAVASSPDDIIENFWYSTMSEGEREARQLKASEALNAACSTIYAIHELPAALAVSQRSC
eukprot:scaffold217042_cov32-Tisochrysis_lutea.AAC.1